MDSTLVLYPLQVRLIEKGWSNQNQNKKTPGRSSPQAEQMGGGGGVVSRFPCNRDRKATIPRRCFQRPITRVREVQIAWFI